MATSFPEGWERELRAALRADDQVTVQRLLSEEDERAEARMRATLAPEIVDYVRGYAEGPEAFAAAKAAMGEPNAAG